MLEWVDDREQPFFAVVHLREPQHNYQPNASCRGRFTEGLTPSFELPVSQEILKSWIRRTEPVSDEDIDYVRRLYDEEVCTMDQAIGELVAGLEARERWDDTWFVLTGDHGEELWDSGNFGHGHTVKSVLTNVPLLVRIPGFPTHSNDSVVGHVELISSLRQQQGPLWLMLETGETVEGRVAFSSSPSRTLDQFSVVTETERTVVLPDSKTAMVWDLDERGWETGINRTHNTEAAVRDSPEYALLATVKEEPLDPTLPARFSRMDGVDLDRWAELAERRGLRSAHDPRLRGRPRSWSLPRRGRSRSRSGTRRRRRPSGSRCARRSAG